jgi:hypothetical protein
MSAKGQKRTLMGFAVRWRNVLVFDRNYVAFQALLDSSRVARISVRGRNKMMNFIWTRG